MFTSMAAVHGVRTTPQLIVAGLPDHRPGRGETAEYLAVIQRLIAAVGAEDLVEVLPFDHNRSQIEELIRSSDIALLAYETDDHVVAPALVDAIAASKPVVSTGFPHAVELLSTGAGLVVPSWAICSSEPGNWGWPKSFASPLRQNSSTGSASNRLMTLRLIKPPMRSCCSQVMKVSPSFSTWSGSSPTRLATLGCFYGCSRIGK